MTTKNWSVPRCGLVVAAFTSLFSAVASAESLRPPAVPLVTCDPYFSIWSASDRLNESDTVHWTSREHGLWGKVFIDGRGFGVIGKTELPALPQTSLEVLPTRTIYQFEGEGVRLRVTFMTPALPYDVSILSRPVTYVTWDAAARDERVHRVRFEFKASPHIAVNEPAEATEQAAETRSGMFITRIGSVEQPVLARKGDDLRINWGYLYVAEPTEFGQELSVSAKEVSRWLMLAYDDLFSIQYMHRNLRPYWRRNGDNALDLLRKAKADYARLKRECERFDAELMGDLRESGGEEYARLAALAYRQCFAAGKFVADANGKPLQFCKENHSNGCIGTSDVFYPMSPQFLLFGPTLAKSFVVPFMNYAASARWKFPFAPHDLGTYPKANGQVYGGGERTQENQMPVEESGNLLLLMGAIGKMEGNAKFARLYWKQLEQWAEYLKEKGFDPENQLCTDDFAGHLAHNVNLSAKAIVGLGSFARLCEMRARAEHSAELSSEGEEYMRLARQFAQRWVKEADDGDHYRLAFDKPNTWSQKYNLIWDGILELNLFPPEAKQKEMAFYRRSQNKYGLPLDNRKDYTKLDWITWTATLTQQRSDFAALIHPVYTFLNETPVRSPMTDWYDTKTAKKIGFTARPVVGGVFAQLLYRKEVWNKWAHRDKTSASHWAPMPVAASARTLVPAADVKPAMWRYTFAQPATNWFEPNFDASSWAEGLGGFGTVGTPGARIGTKWDSSDIWLRREVELPPKRLANIAGWLHHDEDAEVYVNGAVAVRTHGYSTDYDLCELSSRAIAALKAGKNTLAIHCHQTTGGQYIDFGFVEAEGR